MSASPAMRGARAVPVVAEALSYDPALPTRVSFLAWLLAAGSLSAATWLLRADGVTGLTLTIQAGPDLARPAPPRRVATVDTRDLWADAGLGAVRARWDGFWRVEAGPHELEARSDGVVLVSVDGREVLSRRPGARSRGVSSRLDL